MISSLVYNIIVCSLATHYITGMVVVVVVVVGNSSEIRTHQMTIFMTTFVTVTYKFPYSEIPDVNMCNCSLYLVKVT